MKVGDIMAVTIKDIAKLAGVSYSTVSRSLNDSELVAEKTRKRVKRIANELGFEFNAGARSLSTSRTGTVGIIYPDDFENFGTHLYYSSLHHQLRRGLEKQELDLIVAFSENSFTGKNNVKRLITQGKLDGLIIAQTEVDHETLDYIEASKIPYVFFHHPVDLDLGDVDAIYMDHIRGGYIATEHLIEKGRRKLLCIAAGQDLEYRQRSEGFKKALKDHRIPFKEDMIITAKPDFKIVQEMVKDNIQRIKEADGLFVQTDLMAWGVLEYLKITGVKVPEDIAIVGYDNIELSEYLTPSLTTVHQPREEIGLLTCERLVQKINEVDDGFKKKRRILLQPKLVVRQSSGE
tara:strand:- start:60 stop:1103 length:1044 start_codon:yes stop_codon:yes gene_type:complete